MSSAPVTAGRRTVDGTPPHRRADTTILGKLWQGKDECAASVLSRTLDGRSQLTGPTAVAQLYPSPPAASDQPQQVRLCIRQRPSQWLW
jgi:hypothetical protein